MKRYLIVIPSVLLLWLTFGCKKKESLPTGLVQVGNVTVQEEEGYYRVNIELSQDYSRRQTGENYGKAIKAARPDIEQVIDSYLNEITQKTGFNAFLQRINDIKGNMSNEYIEEIEGLASALSGAENSPGDGVVSKDEVYLTNLISDVMRGTQCSAISVFGEMSAANNTITGRNLDWPMGQEKQLAKLHSVTIINNNEKSVCLIGFLGYLGCITGFNNDNVFAATLDSETGFPYSSANKRSYVFDMRYALENMTSMEEIANHLMDPGKDYAFNHLYFLSDENKSMVLENNISGNGADMKRALRTYDSELNESISWGIENAIGAVNSFLLKGNHDNHTENPFNFGRWSSLRSQTVEKADDGITYDEIRKIE